MQSFHSTAGTDRLGAVLWSVAGNACYQRITQVNKFFFVVLQKRWLSFRGESSAGNPNIITVSSDWLVFRRAVGISDFCRIRPIFSLHTEPGQSCQLDHLPPWSVYSRYKLSPDRTHRLRATWAQMNRNMEKTEFFFLFGPLAQRLSLSTDSLLDHSIGNLPRIRILEKMSSIRFDRSRVIRRKLKGPKSRKIHFHSKRLWHHSFEMKTVLDGSMSPFEQEFVSREDSKMGFNLSVGFLIIWSNDSKNRGEKDEPWKACMKSKISLSRYRQWKNRRETAHGVHENSRRSALLVLARV